MSVKIYPAASPSLSITNANGALDRASKDLVLARLFRSCSGFSCSGLNCRTDRVAPLLGGDTKINPVDWHKAKTMLGAAVNAPALNDRRLAANGPIAYQPFPGA
jgi:hypothetical protein